MALYLLDLLNMHFYPSVTYLLGYSSLRSTQTFAKAKNGWFKRENPEKERPKKTSDSCIRGKNRE